DLHSQLRRQRQMCIRDRLRSKPLYDLFSEDFKQTVRLADEELYASIVSKDDAKQLMIPEGAPVLHLVRQTYNMKNEIIEFT
ncbi:UTRA domain-containing protein, partial [Enterococcus sp. S181_ASV_20]|nr:UTRA domain-containing protein [Enterococcus sp. S181_ASV_20]